MNRLLSNLGIFTSGVLTCLVFIAGCGGDDDNEASPTNHVQASTTASAAAGMPTTAQIFDHPVGLIAIGHSGLTGENSDPGSPGEVAPANSWATGVSPEVNSIYSRLIRARPETEGVVANRAEGGSPAASLKRQAQRALEAVPNPLLAIIQTIDSDVACDGTDPDHVAEFGKSVNDALETIIAASPETEIVIVTQPGRPERAAPFLAAVPAAKRDLQGSGMCDWWDTSGNLVPEHVANMTAIIEGYEAEQARVCSAYPQCHTDNGAFKNAQIDDLRYLSNDHAHFNVEGLALLAESSWPVVDEVLGLRE